MCVDFEAGEVGKLKEEELISYEASLKIKRDNASVFNSAERIGEARGIEKGERKIALAIALKFKKMEIPVEKIAEGTGHSAEEPRWALRSKIEKLK